MKVAFTAVLQHVHIPMHSRQTDTHTRMFMIDFPSLMHVHLKPNLSPWPIGGTLSRQASLPCHRQHFASRAPPSSHGSTPQSDDSFTLGYDPAGTPAHTHTRTQTRGPCFCPSFFSPPVTHSCPSSFLISLPDPPPILASSPSVLWWAS